MKCWNVQKSGERKGKVEEIPVSIHSTIMSICTGCLQRMCSKHPMLDHGKRERELKAQVDGNTTKRLNEMALNAMKEQIEKLNKVFSD